MKKRDPDYASVEVDERLLKYESCFTELILAQFPFLTALGKKATRAAFLQTQERLGHVRRVQGPNGRVRLEPTEKYLKEFLRGE